MKNLWKVSFFKLCALTFLFSQTGCNFSLYNSITGKKSSTDEIVKNDILPPASGKGNMTGTVLSETDNKPLANVDVLLCRNADIMAGCTEQVGQVKTDQSGVYRFRNLPPGSYVPAIKKSEDSVYVMPAKIGNENLAVAELFKVEAGQTVQIEARKVKVELQNPDPFEIKYISPTNFETIQERKPKLTWEANPQAVNYSPILHRTDLVDIFKPFIKLESYKSDFINMTNGTTTAPLKELEDGIYCWHVDFRDKQSKSSNTLKPYKSESCFVVIGTTQPKK